MTETFYLLEIKYKRNRSVTYGPLTADEVPGYLRTVNAEMKDVLEIHLTIFAYGKDEE